MRLGVLAGVSVFSFGIILSAYNKTKTLKTGLSFAALGGMVTAYSVYEIKSRINQFRDGEDPNQLGFMLQQYSALEQIFSSSIRLCDSFHTNKVKSKRLDCSLNFQEIFKSLSVY